MPQPKISVIMPVYNVREYISETLNSLLNQTMIDDIEVIMVDDGSTDESRYIIEEYALNYDNFHAYHKQNGGQGIARNYGLEIAQGEFIHFFDSDDYLVPDAYEKLYNLALKSNSDIVIGNVLRFARYHEWEDILFKNSFRQITDDIDSTTLDDLPQLVWDTAIWNNIYKKEFLQEKNIRFLDEKIFFEDLLFSIETYLLADSITITTDILYYWRLRNNHSSVTQQDTDIINFKDRLKVLRLIHKLLDKNNASSEVFKQEYLKWINHDLKFFIKRFDNFPESHQRELFDEICELVKLIPENIIDGLNSYKKVIFKMIQNNDFDNFLLFAPLEQELYINPEIPSFINDEYRSYFDFKEAVTDEELIAYLTDFNYDESNLYIDFEGTINYLSDEEYDVKAELVFNGGDCPLEVAEEQSRIIIPISLIKGKNHLKIKVSYIFSDFEKETYLKSKHRQSIEFENTYIDLNMGVNSYLYIDLRPESDNSVEITNIECDDDAYILNGKSRSKISAIHIENVINFKKYSYPVEYMDDGQSFYFKIPHQDIANAPIKKWEINCDDSFNSIKVSHPFEFYKRFNKIRFINSRNKILIENDVYNVIDELYELNSKNKDLTSKISSLKSKNARLRKENTQLKSHILIKISNKLKLK